MYHMPYTIYHVRILMFRWSFGARKNAEPWVLEGYRFATHRLDVSVHHAFLPQRVQVPKRRSIRCQILYLERLSAPNTIVFGFLDPLGACTGVRYQIFAVHASRFGRILQPGAEDPQPPKASFIQASGLKDLKQQGSGILRVLGS